MNRYTFLVCGWLCATPLLAGSSISAAPVAPKVQSAKVTIEGFQFQPDKLTVKAGQKVTFTNKDGTPHTVSPVVAGSFVPAGRLLSGESATVTFPHPGAYDYYCEFHTTMKGRIVVH
jgi:plastocyanin